jgi:hypothetical protein
MDRVTRVAKVELSPIGQTRTFDELKSLLGSRRLLWQCDYRALRRRKDFPNTGNNILVQFRPFPAPETVISGVILFSSVTIRAGLRQQLALFRSGDGHEEMGSVFG